MRLPIDPARVLAMTAAFGLALIGAQAAHAADWPGKAKWDRVVAAAKKEGALNVSGPSGKAWRSVLRKFQDAYPDIKTSVNPFSARAFWPRVDKEREIGKYLWDLRVGGSAAASWKMMASGGIAPVRPMFMLPEVTNEKNWIGGFSHMFLDAAKKYFPTFCIYTSTLAYYNKDVIKRDKPLSLDDMVDPKWKGKISMAEPSAGAALTSMAMLMKDKRYGRPYIRKLIEQQKPAITKNRRQLMDWFVQGRYPISIGIPSSSIRRYEKRGVKLNMGVVAGINRWSPGVCGVQVLEPRPHPNATIVFVNWLFSKKTQEMMMPVIGLNSRHKDVPIVNRERLVDYSRLDDYKSGQTEEFRASMAAAKKFIKGLTR